MEEKIIINNCVYKRTGVIFNSGKSKTIYVGMVGDKKFAWCKFNKNKSQTREKIENEKKLYRFFNNKYIINSFYDDMNNNIFFELFEEGNLEMKIKENKINKQNVWNILFQILRGLEHFHKNNMIHGDIKPSNILIKNNKIKIIDFGLTRELHDEKEIVGSIDFMAPEIFSNNYNEKIDIYSFGMSIISIIIKNCPLRFFKTRLEKEIHQHDIYDLYEDNDFEKIKNLEYGKIAYEKFEPIEADLETIEMIFKDYPKKLKSLFEDCIKPPEFRPSATSLIKKYF